MSPHRFHSLRCFHIYSPNISPHLTRVLSCFDIVENHSSLFTSKGCHGSLLAWWNLSYQVGRYLSFWADSYWETFFITVNETVVHGTVNSNGLIVERIGLPWPRWKITTHLFRFVHILTQLYQNLCRMTPPVLTEAIYHCFFTLCTTLVYFVNFVMKCWLFLCIERLA